ncbi:MAG: hypothetical protein WD428_01055 [Gaiellaceae bacterium]
MTLRYTASWTLSGTGHTVNVMPQCWRRVKALFIEPKPFATLDEMPLLDGAPVSGGAFPLGGEAPTSTTEARGSGWVVEIREGSKYVVARGGHESGYDEARKAAMAAANEGLDFIAMRGTANLTIVGGEDDHIVWWAERRKAVLRTVGFVTTFVEVGIPTLTVRDPVTGEPTPQPPAPPEHWHESFRYFRLSQVTDDLFEAYRNAYLALESILDSIHPKTGGGERRWLEAALRVASGRIGDLTPFTPEGSTNATQGVRDDLYSTNRTALFHSKGSQGFFLPHDPTERAAVSEALSRLVRLYLALATSVTNVRRPMSGITHYFFRMQTSHLDTNLKILVTDEEQPFDPSDEVVNPTGGRLVPLRTKPAPEHERPFVRAFLGTTSGSELEELTHVGRICSTLGGDPSKPITANWPEGRLVIKGLQRFEALMGLKAQNVRQPRTAYSS